MQPFHCLDAAAIARYQRNVLENSQILDFALGCKRKLGADLQTV
jgi:hypothetical protein